MATYERPCCKPHRKELPIFGEWFFHFPLGRTQGRANMLEAKFLSGVYLGLQLRTKEMYIGIATGVVSAPAIRRKTSRTLCLERVERSCGCTLDADARSTARWRRSASSKVSHCSRRWRGTIASATEDKEVFWPHSKSTSVQVWKPRSTE